MSVKTGNAEPDWPTVEGARIIEYSDADASVVTPVDPDPAPPRLPPDLDDRYGNRYWDPDRLVHY